MIPFIVYASVRLGVLITGEDISLSMESLTQDFGALKHLKTYIIGSLVLATAMALLFGLVSYLILTQKANRKIATDNG